MFLKMFIFSIISAIILALLSMIPEIEFLKYGSIIFLVIAGLSAIIGIFRKFFLND